MKRVAFVGLVVAAFIAGLIGFAVKGAVPTVNLSSQAWWNAAGIVIPSAVGKHVHLDATVPADGYPIDGLVTITGTVTLHGQIGATDQTSWLRAGDEDVLLAQQTFVLGPCADCSAPFSLTLDLGKLATGRHELRISANIPNNAEGHRQFQSTGWQVCVRSCTPTYRPAAPVNIARGWYSGHGYQNAQLTGALTTIRPGGTINVKLGPGSGGLATKLAGVFIDPAFHSGLAGIVVHQWAGAFSGSVTLPVLSPGSHKLVLLSSDGQDAGVLAIPFEVAP